MTENQWPQDPTLGTPTATQQTPPMRQASTFPAGASAGTPFDEPAGAGSKKDAAKDEAAEVTRQAAGAAQNVAGTAKAEAANVAAEVKTNAMDLVHQAKSGLSDQASTQQQKVAEGIRSISTQLHSMASAPDQPGVASDLVRQAAERSSAVATWLDARDPASLLTEVQTFARQRPGTFLLIAAGAGVLAGRLSRSLSAGAPDATGTASSASVSRVPDTGMAVPPPPVQLPAPAVTTAGAADTYPPSPLGSPTGVAGRQDRWGTEPVVTDPLTADPFSTDPFEGGRR